MPYDEWIARCRKLNDRIIPAASKRFDSTRTLMIRARSKVLQDRYLEAWVLTSAVSKISSQYLSRFIQQLSISQVEAPNRDAHGQKIEDFGIRLALDSLENLVGVIEISNLRSLKRVLQVLLTQLSDALVPWLDVIRAIKEITDALATPSSEADEILLELEAYEIAALTAATWAVGQVSAFIGPPDENILALPLDEAVAATAAATRAIVDATIRDVRAEMAANPNEVLI
jgi:hypothetical protein